MTQHSIERPLTPWAKTGLIASTTAIVLAFYLFALVSGLLLAVLLAFEALLVLGAARFGVAGWMIRIMDAHVRVVGILLRSLWLPKNDAEYRIALQEADAPALFRIIRQLAEKFQVKAPDEVQLEMSVNAWVQLRGFRSGAGKTRLGIGFDLLAGLTVSEVEGVIAHELAHARLVQRGFKYFANSALMRCARLEGILSAHVQEARNRNEARHLAETLLRAADALIRVLARLVAAYSRQDEFEADRGAAEICGANALRSSLLKLNPLSEVARRLPWRERVAQMQSGQSYSEWFLKELAVGLQAMTGDDAGAEHVFDRYSTHPALHDRLAALPADVEKECDSTAAVTLLANPDSVVEKLIEEIQRVGALQEEKDTKALEKWNRATGRRVRIRPLQWLGIVIGIAFCFTGFLAPIGIILGMILYRKGRYRDPQSLPVPEYASLTTPGPKLLFDQQQQMEADFMNSIAAERKKKKRAAVLIAESYKALAGCDYLRAHVAARCVFKADPKSVEGHIAFAIAAAGVNQFDAAGRALRYVNHQTGFRSESTMWGAAWTLILLHDWAAAEALLNALAAKNPEQRTFLCLLALTRSRRGKTHSAIAKARQACTPCPRNKEEARLLIGILLDAGLLREAAARLAAAESLANGDEGLQMQMVRLKLLTHAIPEAEEWTRRIIEKDTKPPTRLALAHYYLQARELERAAGFFGEVQASNYFPEALVGLADVEMERKNFPAAREYLLTALNLKTALAEGATGPLPLFHGIVGRLCAMEPIAQCSAWLATLPPGVKSHDAFKNTSYLIFAPSQHRAVEITRTIMFAMDPEFPMAGLEWKMARGDQQPARPVHPGIQRVFVAQSKKAV